MSHRIEHLADGVTLYCGRCEDVLPTLPRPAAIITDPPYGLGDKMKGGTWAAKPEFKGMPSWDGAPPEPAFLDLLLRSSDRVVLWGGNYFALRPSRCWFVWDKANAVPTMSDFEMAWTNLDRPSKRFIGTVGRAEHGHPTSKPEALMCWCIRETRVPARGVICDPYMGSGTTGVSAVRAGHGFVGMELKPNYFDIAARRIEAELSRPRLFADPVARPVQEALL